MTAVNPLTILKALAVTSLITLGAFGGDSVECGNRIVEQGETCDDGNRFNGDGCSSICRVESVFGNNNNGGVGNSLLCGNSRIDVGETCDEGPQRNGQLGGTCSATCQRTNTTGGVFGGNNNLLCGNGRIDAGETCDDGAQRNGQLGSTCSITCQRTNNNGGVFGGNNGGVFGGTGGVFGGGLNITCGDSHRYSTAAPEATLQSRGYNCTNRNTNGPEITYNFIAPGTGGSVDVYARLNDGAGHEPLDIYILDQFGNCIDDGERDAGFRAIAGQRYSLVVDGRYQSEYTLDVLCNGGFNNGGFNNGGINNGGIFNNGGINNGGIFNNGGFNNGGFNNGGFNNGGTCLSTRIGNFCF